jgi:hypothetical protein
MKPYLLVLVSITTSAFFLSLPALAQSSKSSPVRVSVAKFTDKTSSGGSIGSGCHSYYAWADRLGGAFSDLLVEKLESNPKLEVLERSAIYDLYEKEVEKRNQEKDAMNAQKRANEWGSQIRSYTMQPFQLVKDVRTDFSTSQVQDVMDGDLDGFIMAYLKEINIRPQ